MVCSFDFLWILIYMQSTQIAFGKLDNYSGHAGKLKGAHDYTPDRKYEQTLISTII